MDLAMKVLSGMRQKCPHCGGLGIVERGDMSYRFPWADAEWSYCPVCEGGGGVWSAPERELIGAYRHVVDHFPDAALPGALDYYGLLALEEEDAPDE
jgi:DnaJ-class molecular chaperone